MFFVILILLVLIFIFLQYYTLCSLRTRRLVYKIPGFTELESWILSYKSAVLPSDGVKGFLLKLFGDNTSIRAVWFLGVPNVNIASPENLEELLKSVQHITKGTEYYIFADWLGEGLLTSTGAKWHASRKLLTPAFHFRILESCYPIFNSNSQLLVKLLKEQCGNGNTLRIEQFISLCSLDIISEAAMGVQLDAQLQKSSTVEYVNAVKRMGELCLHRVKAVHLTRNWIYNLTSEGREQKRILKVLHGFTESVIKESKHKRQIKRISGDAADLEPAAFVDFLLEMAENEPGLYTDVEIRQEVDTFMFEGHETTSASVTWSLLLLGHDEEVQERAYNELVEIFGDSNRSATKRDLSKMTYLEAVIKESLRLYPPVAYISRKIDTDLKLEKYTVPAGTNMIIIPYLLHRQEQLFPDPEKFDPDRFLTSDKPNRHPFSYIPFSGGPRNCIGQRFAMIEMKVILSQLLRNFRIESVSKREELKLLFSPILRSMDGTYVKLFPRI